MIYYPHAPYFFLHGNLFFKAEPKVFLLFSLFMNPHEFKRSPIFHFFIRSLSFPLNIHAVTVIKMLLGNDTHSHFLDISRLTSIRGLTLQGYI